MTWRKWTKILGYLWAAGIAWCLFSVPVLADVVVSGDARTQVPDSTAQPDARNDDFRLEYAQQKGMTVTEAEAYLANYKAEYFGGKYLSGVDYTVTVEGVDDWRLRGTSCGGGYYTFDLPEQYRDDLEAGKVNISFEMNGPDRSNVFASENKSYNLLGIKGQYFDDGATVQSPPHAMNDVAVATDDHVYMDTIVVTDPDTASANNIYSQIENINVSLELASHTGPGQSWDHISFGTPSIRYLNTSGAQGSSSVAEINATLGTSTLVFDQNDPTDILSQSGSGYVYHEYGHHVFSKLVGIEYTLYTIGGGNHEMGGRLTSQKYAFNESYAHFMVSVGTDLSKGLYDAYDKDYITSTIYVENKQVSLQQSEQDYIDGKITLDQLNGTKTDVYNRLKRSVEATEAEYNELVQASTNGDLNYYEGYATEFFNEIYFSGPSYFGSRDEAFAKINAVIASGLTHPGNIDDFFDSWIALYPDDQDEIEAIRQTVSTRIFLDRYTRLQQMKAELQALEDELWPDAATHPCSIGKAGLGSGCNNQPGPIFYLSAEGFLPAGLAVCPNERAFFVTDNTNGRLLMFKRGDPAFEKVVLEDGLQQPGDVDIADGGLSLVYSTSGGIRRTFFGLTARISNADGVPIAGAQVVADSGPLQKGGVTNTDGMVTIMGLRTQRSAGTPFHVTVTYGSISREYTVYPAACQTCAHLTFSGDITENRNRRIVVVDRRKPKRVPLVVTPAPPQPGDAGYNPPQPPAPGLNAPPPGPVHPPQPPPPPPPVQCQRPDDNPVLTPPVVNILLPVNGSETADAQQIVQGTVSDLSVREAVISINGTDIQVPVHNGEFYYALTLEEGINTMQARATSTILGSDPPVTQDGMSEPVQVTYTPGGTTPTGSVYGRVHNGYTGQPIAGARVIAEESGQQVTTDSSGYYSFGALPEGEVTLRAENP